MAAKGSLLPPPVKDDQQHLFNQQVADKYNKLVTQITEIPDGLTAQQIIDYLKGLKV